MSTDTDYTNLETEIRFFMEKAFQITFGYFAALIAFLAFSRTDTMKALLSASGLSLWPVAALVVLVLNLVYITLACTCLFAVIKRGLFIQVHSTGSGNDTSLGVEWPRFLHDDSLMPIWSKLRPIAWNIDNYFMMPIYAVIVAISTACAWVDFSSGELEIQIVTGVVVLLYVVPAFILYCMSCMDRARRRLLYGNKQATIDTSVAAEPDTSGAEDVSSGLETAERALVVKDTTRTKRTRDTLSPQEDSTRNNQKLPIDEIK